MNFSWLQKPATLGLLAGYFGIFPTPPSQKHHGIQPTSSELSGVKPPKKDVVVVDG
jgi:hypothetical protein